MLLKTLEDRQISDQKIFMRRLDKKAPVNGHFCSVCLLEFSSKQALNIHNKKHFAPALKKGNYIIPKLFCTVCKGSFDNKDTFHDHLLDENHINSNILHPVVSLEKDSNVDKLFQENKSEVIDELGTEKPNSISCATCTKKFLKKSIYEKHKQFHKPSSNFECPNCFKPLDSTKKILRHKILAHSKKERKFECFCCRKEFSKYSSLLYHFQSSTCNWKKAVRKRVKSVPNISPIKSTQVICQICFTSSSDILHHVKTHTSGYHYECYHCLKGFLDLESLKVHKEKHIDGNFECHICSKQPIKTYEDLVLHLKICKPKPDENALDTDSQTTIDISVTCQVCFKKVLTPSMLPSHLKLHTSGEQFECCFCFLGFDDEESLQEHKFTHDIKRPYQCLTCKQKFRNAPELMSHFMESKHKDISLETCGQKTRYEPVAVQIPNSDDINCSVCHKRFTAPTKTKIKEYFNNHLQFHSRIFPHECPFCFIGFSTLFEMKIHKKTHITSGKRYTCTVCSFVSENFAKFRNHLEETNHRKNLIQELLEFNNSPNKYVHTETESDSDFVFSKSTSLQDKSAENFKVVSPKWRFECPLCSVNLGSNREAFETHIKLHKSSSISCLYCQAEFANFDAVDEHIKDNHKDKSFGCPFNDFSSESHSSLLLHFEIAGHKSLNEEDLSNIKQLEFENKSYGQDRLFDTKKTLECSVCSESLESSAYFQLHLKLHTQESRFECRFCFQNFPTIEEQLHHVKETHLKRNNVYYQCQKCQFKTQNKYSLLKHAQASNHFHGNGIPARDMNNLNIFGSNYKSKEIKSCPVCFMELEGERSLKSHQKIHQTGFPMECSQCLMGFVDRKKLDKHRSLHCSFFECLNCSEEFETYVRYIKHLEDTGHNDLYKNSYEKHSLLIPKSLQVSVLIAEEDILMKDIEGLESSNINIDNDNLADNIVSACDFELGCIEKSNLVIEDELCSLSGLESKVESAEDKDSVIQKPYFSDSDNDFNLSRINFDYKSFSDSHEDNVSETKSELQNDSLTTINEVNKDQCISRHMNLSKYESQEVECSIKSIHSDAEEFSIDSMKPKFALPAPDENSDLDKWNENGNNEVSYMQSIISRRKEYIEKISGLVAKYPEKGVTSDLLEAYFCTTLEADDFKHSLHSYVEAALLHGKIKKEVKDGEEIFYPQNGETSKSKLKICGTCSTCKKDNCGNCKSCVIDSSLAERGRKKRCFRKRCMNLKKVKEKSVDEEKNRIGMSLTLTDNINTILSHASKLLEYNDSEVSSVIKEDYKDFGIQKEEVQKPQSSNFIKENQKDLGIQKEEIMKPQSSSFIKEDQKDLKIEKEEIGKSQMQKDKLEEPLNIIKCSEIIEDLSTHDLDMIFEKSDNDEDVDEQIIESLNCQIASLEESDQENVHRIEIKVSKSNEYQPNEEEINSNEHENKSDEIHETENENKSDEIHDTEYENNSNEILEKDENKSDEIHEKKNENKSDEIHEKVEESSSNENEEDNKTKDFHEKREEMICITPVEEQDENKTIKATDKDFHLLKDKELRKILSVNGPEVKCKDHSNDIKVTEKSIQNNQELERTSRAERKRRTIDVYEKLESDGQESFKKPRRNCKKKNKSILQKKNFQLNIEMDVRPKDSKDSKSIYSELISKGKILSQESNIDTAKNDKNLQEIQASTKEHYLDKEYLEKETMLEDKKVLENGSDIVKLTKFQRLVHDNSEDIKYIGEKNAGGNSSIMNTLKKETELCNNESQNLHDVNEKAVCVKTKLVKAEPKIPIYKKEVSMSSHQEVFSEKFVNRNILLKSKQRHPKPSLVRPKEIRKFIERKKFGSLSTKFTGKKSITNSLSFEKDDPFSIDSEDQFNKEDFDKSSTKIRSQSTLINYKSVSIEHTKSAAPPELKDNIKAESGSNYSKNTTIEKSGQDIIEIKRKRKNSSEEVMKEGVAFKHLQSTKLKESISGLIERKKSSESVDSGKEKYYKNKKIPKKKKDKQNTNVGQTEQLPNVDPSCPHCFKLLLNPTKMRLHISECKMNKERDSNNSLRLKIQISPDTKKIKIKEQE